MCGLLFGIVILVGLYTLLEDDSVLIKTIEGEDWNDCMTKYHEFMGWEPYKPF